MDKTRRLNKDSIIGFINNTSYFRFTFLASLFFLFDRLFPALFCIVVVWSVYLFYKKLIKQGYIKKIRYRKVIYLFLGCGLVTVIMHSEQNLLSNLFILYWLSVCFFFFYGLHSEQSHIRSKREAIFLFDFIVVTTSVIMIAGFILLAIFPKGLNLFGYDFGIHENRFVGIGTNANVIAFDAVMAIVAAHILWKMKKTEGILSKKNKVIYIASTVINMAALFLSDSNASLLFIITYVCFLAFYSIFRSFKRFGFWGFLLRLTSTVLACAAITLILFGMRSLTQSCVSLMLTNGESKTQISNSVTTSNGSVHIKDDVQTPPPTTFGHQNKNVDSGRFIIWKQALGLFEKFPIMGIGQANIVSYGDIYIGGLKYNDFHNGLLTIIISFGLVGFNIFMVLAITVAKAMLKAIFLCKDKCHRDGDVLVLIVAFCAAYCLYSMFEIALLLDLSYRVFIFWFIIGLGLSYVFRYEKEKDLQTVRAKTFVFASLPQSDKIVGRVSETFRGAFLKSRTQKKSADKIK